jgi:diguanylate cyclase (GGDEF)-like protein
MIYPITLGLLLAAATLVFVWLEKRTPQLKCLLTEHDLPVGKAEHTSPSDRDPVTHLLARHVVVAHFQRLLAQARRSNTSFGVILVGLNDFDRFSKQFGKDSGNDLLAAVGRRLVAVTRETDTVGFMRGQDFAVLMPNLQSPGGLDAMVAKLRAALETPFTLPGVQQTVSAAVYYGTAVYRKDGTDWTTILTAADNCLRRTRFCPKATGQSDTYDAPAGIREALATMGLSWPITAEAVKSRYKALAKRDHPDANGGNRDAEERLKTVNLAYAAIRSVLEPRPGRFSRGETASSMA